MKAIILAAGFGRRMRPLTDTQHKTLLTIGERAVIQWIIDALLAYQITDITIVTGYLSDQLTAFLTQAYPDLSIHYIHNARYAQTNNIYSMALALEHTVIDSDVLLIECDLIFEPAVLGRLLASTYPNVALLDAYRSGMDGTVVEVADGVITSVIPPHLQSDTFDFSDKYKTLNLYRFSQAFCNGAFKKLLTYYADVVNDKQYYELILGILIYLQQEVIHAEVLQGERWAEIDDPNDLDGARFLFEPHDRQRILDQGYGGYWNYAILDFTYLRNMYFPTQAILAEMRNELPALVQNYGSAQRLLNRKLAYFLLCREEYVTALNGASQAYPLLQQYGAAKRVLIPAPSFGEYQRIFPQANVYYDEVGLAPDAIAAQANDHDLIVLVNPNTPTGSLLPTGWIYALALAHPDKTILVDESFIEFSTETSLLPRLDAQPLPNVILLKSLSKILGVPGLRLGYLYTSNTDFLRYLRQAIPIWNMNAIAEYYLEIILKHREALRVSFEQTAQDREQLARDLAALPIVAQVHPSGGNFLLVALRCSRSVCRSLVTNLVMRHNIYVKDVSDRLRGETAYLRVAVRLPHENARLIASLAELATELPKFDD